MHEHEVPNTEIEPGMLALPIERTQGMPELTHVEEAMRASGLEQEIPTALPVRGGDRFDPWHTWEESTWTGHWGRVRDHLDLEGIHWPDSLYIPRTADYRDYWLTPPPSDHRYALAWPSATGATASASADTGDLFAFANTPWFDPGADSRNEAGVGASYSPDFSLGTVDFQPIVNLKSGMLTSVLNYFPVVSAGSVTVQVSIVLAVWQVIPGGFDLIDHGTFPMARITRDQSFGPERHTLPGSLYTPRPFRRRFLVQGGREYLFGAVLRAQSVSTLTDSAGRKLVVPQPSDNDTFTVYAWASVGIPYMTIETAQVYIP